MNTRVLFASIISIGFLFTACNDDNSTAKPEITLSELGLNNSMIGYIGGDLHVEAEIVAEGKIKNVNIEIHTEAEGEDEKSVSGIEAGSSEWKFDSTFTEFSGLKNTTFHKHLIIPGDIDTGEYHFHFTVTDMAGYQTTVEKELNIKKPTDTVAPKITIKGAPSNNQEFSNDQTITISGTISDETLLGGIYIGLVGVDQNLEDADVEEDNTISLLHNHSFEDAVSYDFNASIKVGASKDNNDEPKDVSWKSGNYYLVVKCKDAYGNNWSYSEHYPIVLSL